MRPLVLITGTSSGIGLATAVACAEAGFEVVATMRNLERRGELEEAARARDLASDLETARGVPTIHIEQLDVCGASPEDRVRELLLKYGPIELLVNNAGIAVRAAFEEQSDRDVRDQFETNLFGAMAVTRALLPNMRAARRGCIVNVTSLTGWVGVPGLAAYAASKHALEGFSEALRHELAPFSVHVCLVEPGSLQFGVFTDNPRRGALVEDDGAYAAMRSHLDRVVEEGLGDAPDPMVVGRKIARLLGDPSPPFRTVVGGPARAMSALKRLLPDAVFTSAMRRLMGLPKTPTT